MNIIEVNRNTLANLYEQYPESFKDLKLEGNNLIYSGQSVDISKFNINDLMGMDNQFGSSLSVLSSEDIFRIIRLHSVMLSSKKVEEKQESLSDKIEVIKQENPLMKNISVVSSNGQGGHREFINIVDSTGRDHLFENDRNVNIFAIYDILKYQNPGRAITPDELCNAISRKLHSIELENAENLVNRYTTSEDFANKMQRVNAPYKDDKMYSVMGNQEYDIALVADHSSPEGHRIVTFDKNQYGDLVVENHEQNVSGVDTSSVNGEIQENIGFENQIGNSMSEISITQESKKEEIERLISPAEFYRLLNSEAELTQNQRNSVNLYYAYLGDLIIYEDYLMPELREMLNQFRGYVYDLEYGEHEKEINNKQQEAINKNRELEEKKSLSENKDNDLEKAKDNVKRLELLYPGSDNTGSVSTIQVIAFIVGIAIILTAVTLYLIG